MRGSGDGGPGDVESEGMDSEDHGSEDERPEEGPEDPGSQGQEDPGSQGQEDPGSQGREDPGSQGREDEEAQPEGEASESSSGGPESVVPLTRSEIRAAENTKKSHKRRKVAIIITSSVVGLVVLVAAAGAGYLWYENHRIHRVHVKHLSKVSTSGAQRDVENILLIGSTTRCGLAQQNQAFGLCDEGVTGVNSDVVMILHLDPDHHKAAILSIPRDTIVPNAHEDGLNKIDAALGDPAGPSQLIAAITEDFGIPIQHYVELNFDSFQGVVSALGGVKMYFPMPVYDAESSLNIPTAGCIALSPFQALAVVRARHLQYQPPSDAGLPTYDWPYDPQSDLARIRRDHEFLRVVASAVAQRGLGNFVTDIELINSLAGNLEVDQGFSATDMADLILEFHNLNPNGVPQYTLPVVVDGQSWYYKGGGYGDVVFPVQPEDSQVVAQFLGTAPTQTSSGSPLPSPGSFTVAVENGSGEYDEGAQTASALQALGYDVTSVSDTEDGSSTTETTVLYSQPSQLDDALQVQSSLSGLAVLGYDPGIVEAASNSSSGTGDSDSGTSDSGSTNTIDVGSTLQASQAADVVVVTGTNFAVNAAAGATNPSTSTTTSTTTTTPSSSSTTSTAPSAQGATTTTTTTVPATISDNANLAAPTGPTEALEPWDPRSCTATGGPGP